MLKTIISVKKLEKVLRFVVSLFYYYSVILPRRLLGALGVQFRQRLVVLCYHGVLKKQREAFAWQMDALMQVGTPIKLPEPWPRNEPDLLIGVTFDDGYANLLDNALPYLNRKGIPATIFVAVGCLGKRPAWELSDNWLYRQERLLSAEELEHLPGPLITIGSHSVRHINLTQAPLEEAKMELAESKKILEALTRTAIELFAFPYNAANEVTIEAARQAGYQRTFASGWEVAPPDNAPFLIQRIGVNPEDGKLEFWLKVNGAYAWGGYLSKLRETLLNLKAD
jgi:peptidoglycan/xylan/chitin deacetylase (PgdA/CDA1 family)